MPESKYVRSHGKLLEVETFLAPGTPKRRRRTDRLIGCPLEWARRIIPVVRSKEQAIVAIWLHRRQAVCKRELFDVPNKTLQEELGLSRFVKYSTLRRLEKAGAIAVVRSNKRAPQVQILW